MDIKDLKSQAYDALAAISRLQARLQELNNAIANYKDDGPKVGTAQAPAKEKEVKK
jgi:hypothetical protein